MGIKLREMGFKFDKVLSSAFKRALLSAKLAREGYMKDQPENEVKPSVHLLVKAHEFKGVHMQGKIYPGLNREEV